MGSVCLKPKAKALPDDPGDQAERRPNSDEDRTAQAPAGEDLQRAPAPVPVAAKQEPVPAPVVPSVAPAPASAAPAEAGPGPESLPAAVVAVVAVVAQADVCGGSQGTPATSSATPKLPESTEKPEGYDSEGKIKQAKALGENQAEGVRKRMSVPAPDVETAVIYKSETLDQQASFNLRKYAKRNKPANKAKFMTQPDSQTRPQRGSSKEEPAIPVVGAAVTTEASAVAIDSSLNVPNEVTGEQEVLVPTLEEKMIKYDIFDDIDADRLKEFDDLFKKVLQTSNYEAHKKKTKSLNKNKFSTAAAVTTDSDTGQTSIT